MARDTVDFDKYRQRYESDEHWDLRRNFLENHYGSMSENRLLCLAQVFVNVEILGCRYPDAVMSLVHRLSQDLTKPAKKSVPLNRISFVKSDDSEGVSLNSKQTYQSLPSINTANPERAGLGSKKRKCVDQSKTEPVKRARDATTVEDPNHLALLSKLNSLGQLIRQGTISGANVVEKFYLAAAKARMNVTCTIDGTSAGFTCNVSLDNIFVAEGSATSKKAAKGSAIDSAWERLKEPRYDIRTTEGVMRLIAASEEEEMEAEFAESTLQQRLNTIRLNFPNFVVVEHSWDVCALSALNASANLNKVRCSIKEDCGGASILLNDVEVGRGAGENRKVAKLEAAKDALRLLQMVRPTIRIKNVTDGEELTKQMVGSGNSEMPQVENPAAATRAQGPDLSNGQIADDNVGFKLLKLMGWSGGGIGKDESGIVEPVLPNEVVRRAGLGFEGNRTKEQSQAQGDRVLNRKFKNMINKVVQDFARTVVLKDLVFSPEFDNEERRYIHYVAGRFGLKSLSRNGPEGRYLTLRHKFGAQELLQRLLEVGSTEKYEIVPPSGDVQI